MPVRKLGDDEKVTPAGVRRLAPGERIQAPAPAIGPSGLPLSPSGQPPEMSFGQNLSEAARQFNIGAMEPFGLGFIPAQGAGTERPTTAGMGAARMIGNAAGSMGAFMIPATRMADVARVTPSLVPQAGARATAGRLVTEIGETAAQRPGAFWSLELVPAAAAGAMGGLVAGETDSPTARLIAETAGGVVTGVGAPAVAAYAKVSPVVGIAQSAWRAFRDRGEATGVNYSRAVGRFRTAEPNAREALQRAGEADVLPDAPLTLAELTESPGLLSLQRSVAEATDQLRTDNQQRFADINRIAQDQLRTLGEGPEGPASVADTRAFLSTLLEERVRAARVAVDEAVEALGTNATNASASVFARRELDKAYDAARAQERELWEALELDVPVTFGELKGRYMDLLFDTSQDRIALSQDLFPPRITQALGRLSMVNGKPRLGKGQFDDRAPTMKEMVTLRDELLDFSRAERAKDAPNRRAIRIANILQEGILEDLATNPQASDQLAIARAYSRDMAQRFQQGEVGTLLGFDIEGGRSVDAGLTLERIMGLGGARGRVATGQLLEAVQRTGSTLEMRKHMEDWLRFEFHNQSHRLGEFDANKAANYLARRRDVLGLFPELRRDMEKAIVSGQEFRTVSKMGNPDLAAAALLTSNAPGTEMNRILASSNPGETARTLRGMLDTDPSGKALAGMQYAAVEHLLAKSLQLNAPDARDLPFASGGRLMDQLSNPATRGALEELFSPEQLDTMGAVAQTLRKLDLSRNASPSKEGIIQDREALLLNFARRLGSAALGSRLGAAAGARGNIQIPGMAVKVTDELRKRGIDPARELIIDAMTSPNTQLARALLLEVGDVQDRERMAFVHRQMNAWAALVAARYAMDFSEDSQRRESIDLPTVPPSR